MRTILTLTVLSALALFAGNAQAQELIKSSKVRGTSKHDHDHLHGSKSQVDLTRMDRYAVRLAELAEHLHEDHHEFLEGYRHSNEIDRMVTRFEDLAEHFHEVVHDEADFRHPSASAIRHIEEDLRTLGILIEDLEDILQHQSEDGVYTEDFRGLQHMRSLLRHDARDLVEAMERDLYGRSRSKHHDDHLHGH